MEPQLPQRQPETPQQKRQFRQTVVQTQLNNICQCVSGKWYRAYYWDPQGNRTDKFVIEFPPEEFDDV